VACNALGLIFAILRDETCKLALINATARRLLNTKFHYAEFATKFAEFVADLSRTLSQLSRRDGLPETFPWRPRFMVYVRGKVSVIVGVKWNLGLSGVFIQRKARNVRSELLNKSKERQKST